MMNIKVIKSYASLVDMFDIFHRRSVSWLGMLGSKISTSPHAKYGLYPTYGKN